MPASRDPGAGKKRHPNQSGATPDAPGGRLARRRQRLAPDSGNRLSRPLAAALILIVAGGAYLFWPRGGGAPRGIGEQLTVITTDSLVASAPRSGSVDIVEHEKPLVAEKPAAPVAGGSAGTSPADGVLGGERTSAPATPASPTSPSPIGPQSGPARSSPTPRGHATVTPPAADVQPRSQTEPVLLQPRPTGGWAVQVGAYGNEANAESVVRQLKTKGIDGQVRAANTSTGDIIYRVWIGWFESREQAMAYARQEKGNLGEAHPVHR